MTDNKENSENPYLGPTEDGNSQVDVEGAVYKADSGYRWLGPFLIFLSSFMIYDNYSEGDLFGVFIYVVMLVYGGIMLWHRKHPALVVTDKGFQINQIFSVSRYEWDGIQNLAVTGSALSFMDTVKARTASINIVLLKKETRAKAYEHVLAAYAAHQKASS